MPPDWVQPQPLARNFHIMTTRLMPRWAAPASSWAAGRPVTTIWPAAPGRAVPAVADNAGGLSLLVPAGQRKPATYPGLSGLAGRRDRRIGSDAQRPASSATAGNRRPECKRPAPMRGPWSFETDVQAFRRVISSLRRSFSFFISAISKSVCTGRALRLLYRLGDLSCFSRSFSMCASTDIFVLLYACRTG